MFTPKKQNFVIFCPKKGCVVVNLTVRETYELLLSLDYSSSSAVKCMKLLRRNSHNATRATNQITLFYNREL